MLKFVGIRWMVKLLFGILLFVGGVCVLLYFIQEKIIFFPTKAPKDYKYAFNVPFEEVSLNSGGDEINSILFTQQNSKGVVLCTGTLGTWHPVPTFMKTFSMRRTTFGSSTIEGMESQRVRFNQRRICMPMLKPCIRLH